MWSITPICNSAATPTGSFLNAVWLFHTKTKTSHNLTWLIINLLCKRFTKIIKMPHGSSLDIFPCFQMQFAEYEGMWLVNREEILKAEHYIPFTEHRLWIGSSYFHSGPSVVPQGGATRKDKWWSTHINSTKGKIHAHINLTVWSVAENDSSHYHWQENNTLP